MISAIAVIGKNRELGCDNKLLWDIPDDLKHFKKITSGHPVIMGRRTFESIGSPLPNRTNIIITRDKEYKQERCEITHSIEGAIVLAHYIISNEPINADIMSNLFDVDTETFKGFLANARNDKEHEIFIIGGGEIYKQALPYCDKIYLTIIEDSPKADTYFPDYSEFTKIASEEKHEYNGLKYKFLELTR